MKKTICLILLFSIFSCSSDEPQVNTTTDPTTFQIAAVPNLSTVVIDQEFTITISSDEQMTGIFFSFDNFVTEYGSNSDFGTSKTLKFNLDDIGVTTLYFKAKKTNNVTSGVIAVPINAIRGNAIKITGMQVVSFSGINTTWDPEFPLSDPNHLADVFFGLLKSSINSPFENGYNYRNWYTSSVKQNQGDLTWSFATDNLYIQPERNIRFGLADEDSPPLGQDLMMGPPEYRDFNFSAYTSLKPSTVTFSYPEIDLEFVVTVEWPN